MPDNKEIHIERAKISDLSVIQQMNQKLCAKENTEFDDTIDINFATGAIGTAYFKARIESPDGVALLAKSGGEIVGYLVGGIVTPESYRTIKSLAELENMYVEESMRGKGIGSKLVYMFEKWCTEKKVERIRIIASAENARAIKFYKTQGSFEVCVTLEKKINK